MGYFWDKIILKNKLIMKIDQDLIKKVALGDEKAFTDLYNLISNSLVVYVDLIIKDKQAAEDIVIELFTKIPEIIKDYYSSEKSKFTTFLYNIAKNRAISYLRSRGAKKEISIEEAYVGKERSVTYQYDEFRIEELERILTRVEYQIIILKYVNGYDLNEIADLFHVSRAKIKSIRRKAFKKIKEYYIQNYSDNPKIKI